MWRRIVPYYAPAKRPTEGLTVALERELSAEKNSLPTSQMAVFVAEAGAKWHTNGPPRPPKPGRID